MKAKVKLPTRNRQNNPRSKITEYAAKTGSALVKGADWVKQQSEPWLDAGMAVATANIGAVTYTIKYLEDTNNSQSTNILSAMAATGGLYIGNKIIFSEPIRKTIRKINDELDTIRPIAWAKTAMLAAGLAYVAHTAAPFVQRAHSELMGSQPTLATLEDRVDEKTTNVNAPITSRRTTNNHARPPIYDQLGYKPIIEHDFSGVSLANKNSTVGRIQRTLRWQPIYRAVEKKHGLPEDTLAGMIMQESYGDPVQPNAGDDGGLGVVHVQGTTANHWGLEIHGTSTRASDRVHGKKLKELIKGCHYDPQCLQEYDERAHILKVLDAAARIVRTGMNKHGSIEHGIEYYRAPGKVGQALTWNYMNKVSNFRDAIRDPKQLTKAQNDFSDRNGYSMDKYVSNFHQMSNNWGLENYRQNH